MVPAPVEAPRGAVWAARLISRLFGLGGRAAASPYRRQSPTPLQVMGQRLWRALEAVGRRRAARDLQELARRWESLDPERARLLRDAARFDTQEGSR